MCNFSDILNSKVRLTAFNFNSPEIGFVDASFGSKFFLTSTLLKAEQSYSFAESLRGFMCSVNHAWECGAIRTDVPSFKQKSEKELRDAAMDQLRELAMAVLS